MPGSAFADSDNWNNYMRLCIAREDGVLQGALAGLQKTHMQTSRPERGIASLCLESCVDNQRREA
ncbi:MAG: hypothetical protein ABR568_20465 [Pyrinomonadaceae bacterium]